MPKWKYLKFRGSNKITRKNNYSIFFHPYSNTNSTRKLATRSLNLFDSSRRIYTNTKKKQIASNSITSRSTTSKTLKKIKYSVPKLNLNFIINEKDNNQTQFENQQIPHQQIPHQQIPHQQIQNQVQRKQKLIRLKHNYLNLLLKLKNKTQPINTLKTPIYNKYIPGSGVGASSVGSRRHKKKFAFSG